MSESLSDIFIHKEKKQKKNNKTNGQIDNLKKYSTNGNKSTDKLATDGKQIRREANYIKNIHIDETYERLKMVGLINDDKYKAWWCGVMHTLGVAFVTAQAEHAQIYAKDPSNPAPLFHFLINKAVNKSQDPFAPRFNKR